MDHACRIYGILMHAFYYSHILIMQSLLGAFISPSIANTVGAMQSYTTGTLLGQPPMMNYPLPESDPYYYLPTTPTPTISVGYSFSEILGAIFPLVSMTSLCVGAGAVVGYTSGYCLRRPSKPVDDPTEECAEEPAKEILEVTPTQKNDPVAFDLGEIAQLD